MPLFTVKDLLQRAADDSYAVGAFNCNNMEIIQAIIGAAEAENSPVIVQASQGAIKYAGLEYIAVMALLAAEMTPIPVAVHLDHGTSFEQVVRCITRGFSSVMIDGSALPIKENIALTKEVVKIARAAGVSVEAELGRIGGVEDDISVEERDSFMTDPAEAEMFVEETRVDALAVAVGTAHGKYRGRPAIDFDRLERISKRVDVPLVLHGSSGVPETDIRRAVSMGVRKVNIDTDLREAFVTGIRETLKEFPDEIDPRKVLGPARDKMLAAVREKIRIFGSSGHAESAGNW